MPRSPLLLDIALQSQEDHSTTPHIDRPSRGSFNSDSVDEVRQRLDDMFDGGLIPTPPELSVGSRSPKVSTEVVRERCEKHVNDTKHSDRASDDFERVYSAFLRETSKPDLFAASPSRYGPAPTKPPVRPLPSVPSHESEILALDQLPVKGASYGSAPRRQLERRAIREQDGASPTPSHSTNPKQLSRPGTSASTTYSEADKKTWRVSVNNRNTSASNLFDEDSGDLFKPLQAQRDLGRIGETSPYMRQEESEEPIRRGPLLLSQTSTASSSQSIDREKKLAQLRAQQYALQMEQKRLEEQEAAEQERLKREMEEREAVRRTERLARNKAVESQESDMASEIEVASLRAQVAQLQFALKKQMSGYAAPAMAEFTGLPTPEQSYSGSVKGAFRGHRSPSYNAVEGNHYYPSTPQTMDESTPSIRSLNTQARARMAHEYSDYRGTHSPTHMRFDESVSHQSAARSRYDNASLLSSVHNTSVTNRSDGDMRVDEIAAKLAQLEEMFRAVNASPNAVPTGLPTAPAIRQDAVNAAAAQASQNTLQSHHANIVMRSNSSIGSTYAPTAGRLSPASSVFVYNPTSPYQNRPAATTTNSTSSVNSTVKLEDGTKVTPVMRKGVSRFLLGSTAKLADANGTEVPSVQVSLSRKRGDRVEKPKTKVKSVGRGRVAVVYDKK